MSSFTINTKNNAADEIELEFEVSASDDGTLITLLCQGSEVVDPASFITGLRLFANRLEALSTFEELSGGTLN